MKKVLRLGTLLLILIFIAGCQEKKQKDQIEGSGQEQGRKVIVGLDENFPPMGFRDATGELVGFDIDLAKEVSKRSGLEVEFQPINWDSKELELDGKKVDVLWNGLTMTETRKEQMLFTDPYLDNSQVILVLSNSSVLSKNDLDGKIVGVQKGSSAVEAIKKDTETYEKLGELLDYDENIAAFLDLEIGRVDAVVVDEIVAKYYIAQNDAPFVILEDNFGTEEYGIATRFDDKDLNQTINTALQSMKEDGSSGAISEKWFGENIIK